MSAVSGGGSRFLGAAFLVVASLLPAVSSHAAQNRQVVGSVLLVRGVVTIRAFNETVDRALVKEQEVFDGDVISSKANGRAIVLFPDNTQLIINGNTTLSVTREVERAGPDVNRIDISRGEIWNKAEKSSNTKIKTPVATAAIRGTSWVTRVDQQGNTSVSVLTGQVELSNEQGGVLAGKNETAFAEMGTAPIILKVVFAKDSVQWIYFPQETLRYLHLVSDDVQLLEGRMASLDAREGGPESDLERAEIFHDLGQVERSREILERLAAGRSDARAIADLAIVLMKKGDWTRSGQIVDSLSEGPVQLRVAQALLAMHNNRFDEAARLLEAAAQEDGESVLLSATHAYFLLLRGDVAGAVRYCEENLEKYRGSSVLATILASAYLVSDDLEKAGSLTAVEVRDNAWSALAHFDRAAYLDRVPGNEKGAVEEYRKAAELSPENPYVAKSLGMVLMQAGNYKEALSIFERFSSLGFENAELLYAYGLLLSQVDRDNDAKSEYARARRNEGSVSALSGEGISLLKSGRPHEALEQLTRATVLEPNYALNYVYQAIAFYQLGRVSEASSALGRAKEADQNDATPYIVEAIFSNDRYEPHKALVASRKAFSLLKYRRRGELDFIKATKDGMANIGYSYQVFGLDFWAAIKSHDILEMDPYDPNAHLFPAFVYTSVASPTASQSEYVQGIIMDSSAIIEPSRNRPVIKIPAHYATASLAVGDEGFGVSALERLKASGYVGEPYKVDYFLQATEGANLSLNRYNNGQVDLKATGDFDYRGVRAVLGWHPSYTTNVYARFEGNRVSSATSVYSSVMSLPYIYYSEDSDEEKTFDFLDGGFHYRVAQDSHLLLRPYVVDADTDTTSAGTADPLFLNDTLPTLPASYLRGAHVHESGLQAKHMFKANAHAVSYGMEQMRRKLDISTDARLFISETQPEQTVSEKESVEQKALKFYFRDRWRILAALSVDAGAALQSNWVSQQRENTSFTLCPRTGIDFTPTTKDAFRLAYQRNIIPFTFPYSGARIGYFDNEILSGPGQLEPSDVAGLLPFELASLGLYSDMSDYRFRWERQWTDSLLHFNEVSYQKVADAGEFKMLYSGVNWIAHPRVGVQLVHAHIYDITYESAPFEVDRVSRDYVQFKAKYVHPSSLTATFYQEYYSAKSSYFSSISESHPDHRSSLWLSWESPGKDYAIRAQWVNIFGGRRNLKGLTQDDGYAFVQCEYRF